ncbi:hypothetical protein DPMN_089606 [Dreissena polymorpha]|uniref:Uncharacterized protein n=1 Tax=Dreissena polymorpha TaxID=45954 RepID=A0A9D4KY74_DREPO|nr:hypothetical protein DPMN_089606 [Dreissena polymorpha]
MDVCWSILKKSPRDTQLFYLSIYTANCSVEHYRQRDIIESVSWEKPIMRTLPEGAPGLVMGPCIVEIDHIVIREVQYQLEVNRCKNEEVTVKGNFRWVWPMWAGHPRIDRIVIREVQYQFEVNLLKGNFGWVWAIWAGRPSVQYQFEVNRLKGNFGWVWSMWAGRPRFGNGAMHKVHYQFEVNQSRNEEVNFQGCSANSVGGDSGQDGQTDRRRR